MANQKSNTARALSALTATFLLIVCLQLVTVAISPVSSVPIDTTNYKDLRDLYEMLLSQQQEQGKYTHQMERKGGRAPALRLRFGRRSDPLWSKLSSMQSIEDNLGENRIASEYVQ